MDLDAFLRALPGASVQLASAVVAGYGAVRCLRLQRFAKDRRLTALAWFFALFAGAVFLQAAWQMQLGTPPTDFGPSRHDPAFNVTDREHFGPGLFRPEGPENVNILVVGAHALMLASLVVGVWAFGHRRPPAALTMAAFIPFAAVGEWLPAMLALEAGLALYLAARAFVNHVERRSAGAVQVAIGFFLFFAGHLLFTLLHQPGMGRTGMGDVLGLVGIVLLVQVLPGPRE
ncbi:MAG: hypothetical protein V4510_08785 [bacterium]